jgi:Zn-dependent protease with chaperone function
MKKRLKQFIINNVTLDRLIILFVSIVLVIALASEKLLHAISVDIFQILVAILFIRVIIYLHMEWRKRNKFKRVNQEGVGHDDKVRTLEVMGLINRLAAKAEMDVRLHPNNPLEISNKFSGAKSDVRPYLSEGHVHFWGRIFISSSLINNLDNIALQGVIAHELAHLKKKHHWLYFIPDILLFVTVVLVYSFLGQTTSFTPYFLTFAVWIFVLSFVSWHWEYQVDTLAAKHITKEIMIFTLSRVSEILYRPADTILHPSFKKRISHLS